MKTLNTIIIGLALGCNALACGPDGITNNYYGEKGSSGTGGNDLSDVQKCEDVLRSCNEQTSGKASLGFCSSEDAQIPGCMECVLNAPCSKDYEIGRGSPVDYCLYTGDCPH